MRPEPVQISDNELLQAITRGDEQALAQLYDRYRSILFGLLLRILNSRAEAEDILQEVFLQVWQRARDFDQNRGKVFTWLVTLARSRAIDRLRALGTRERTAIAAAHNTNDVVSDAEQDAMLSQRNAIIRTALRELSEDQRQVLLMAYFDGFSQSEIAEKLDSPLGTVKTRMRAGMMKLREILNLQAPKLTRN